MRYTKSDIELLGKCLRMLQSSSEGEVLAAANKLNKLQKTKEINLVYLCEALIQLDKQLSREKSQSTYYQAQYNNIHRAYIALKNRGLLDRIINKEVG